MSEEEVGAVVHFFSNIMVAGIELAGGPLRVGDTVRFKGHTTDFTQRVESMQVDNADVVEAGPGDEVGMKVADKVRQHDKVYRITET